MDFDLTHEQRQILEYGNVVAQKYDRKYWMDCAEKHVFPDALYRQVADDGFVGTMVPEEYGGAGQGMVEMHLFVDSQSGFLSTGKLDKSAPAGGQHQLAAAAPQGHAAQQKSHVTITTDGPKLSITVVTTNAGWRVTAYDQAS